MTVVVGHATNPEGRLAIAVAISEAAARGVPVLVVAPATADHELLARQLAAQAVEFEVQTAHGVFAEELVAKAWQAAAEIIVIGLRRRNSEAKLLLGAGAQHILLEAPCPVLAVKPHEDAFDG